jgi:SAM-dependent methyltransferase
MPSARQLLHSLRRAAHDRDFRRDLLWRRLPRPRGVFQISGDTSKDRYPRIFRFTRDAFGENPPARLLSFGCSTGEEVFTLRRYFPLARIEGIDINPYRIRTCRERLHSEPDGGLDFTVAGSTTHLPDASYDAIFCLAVLRHGGLQEGPAPRCDHLLRFADFSALVADFARCLKPGGLLAIAHSNFRFADTPTATAFEVVLRATPGQPGSQTPLYGRDNRLLPSAIYRDVVFRKRSA